MATINPGSVILPNATNYDRAYQAAIALPSVGAATPVVYKAGGFFYEIVLSVYVKFVTDNTVGTRNVFWDVLDATGAVVVIIPAPGTQAASTTGFYTFSTAVITTLVTGSNVQTVSIPPLPLYPAWAINIAISGTVGAGDQFTQQYITVQRYPSGGGQIAPVVELVPTPIAL
jgi:hypothetical protein